jgi:hypothetical protein
MFCNVETEEDRSLGAVDQHESSVLFALRHLSLNGESIPCMSSRVARTHGFGACSAIL